jgi:hypothetical protein
VSFSSNGVSLDTDTSDIAINGDGGDLVLEWTVQGNTTYSSNSKQTIKTATSKTITFSGYEYSDATVEGSFFGDGYVSTGTVRENKGKTITQIYN